MVYSAFLINVSELCHFLNIIISIMEPPTAYRWVVKSPRTEAIFDFRRLSFKAEKKTIFYESCNTYCGRNFRLSMQGLK